MNRIVELAGILSKGLARLGFDTADTNFKGTRTGIICARHPEVTASTLVSVLEEERVIARERSGYLRMAPHIYQSPEHMEKALSILARAV